MNAFTHTFALTHAILDAKDETTRGCFEQLGARWGLSREARQTARRRARRLRPLSRLQQALKTSGASAEISTAVEAVCACRCSAQTDPRLCHDGGDGRAMGEGRYALIERLGGGGFGDVFKALDVENMELVAIKRLKLDRTHDIEQTQRLMRALTISRALTHPSSATAREMGLDAGLPFLVFDYIDGVTLRYALKRQGAIPEEVLIPWTRQVLSAMAEAHGQGVVHRDLNPSNIMLEDRGDHTLARVIDHGIAGVIRELSEACPSITTSTTSLGTPRYMPREQLMQFNRPRPESDVYALGLILGECLTGAPLIKGETRQDVLREQLSYQPVELPTRLREHALGRVIATACERSWRRRYGSAGEMLTAMDRALDHARVTRADETQEPVG